MTGEPFIVCCDPKHHRSHLRVLGVFDQRPYRFGPHTPVRCAPEKIVRVGDPLASQNGVLSGEPEHPAMETSASRANETIAKSSAKRANHATILTKIKRYARSLMA